MADAQNIEGAAEKISGLLNPKDQQETETNAEPSETPEKQEAESQPESEGTKAESTENAETTEETTTELQEEPELHRVKIQGQELEVTLD